jgi:hypothetical protein
VTQDEALFRFRLRVFAVAEELGNVRAACRMFGVHPSMFYRWRGHVLTEETARCPSSFDMHGPNDAIECGDDDYWRHLVHDTCGCVGMLLAGRVWR